MPTPSGLSKPKRKHDVIDLETAPASVPSINVIPPTTRTVRPMRKSEPVIASSAHLAPAVRTRSASARQRSSAAEASAKPASNAASFEPSATFLTTQSLSKASSRSSETPGTNSSLATQALPTGSPMAAGRAAADTASLPAALATPIDDLVTLSATPPRNDSTPVAPSAGQQQASVANVIPAAAVLPETSEEEPEHTISGEIVERWIETDIEFYCAQCVLGFQGSSVAYNHITHGTDHEQMTPRCTECFQVIEDYRAFLQHVAATSHMRVTGREGRLVISPSMTDLLGVTVFTTRGCPYCHAQIPDDSRNQKLKEHVRVVHLCQWCHSAYPNKEIRNRHYREEHSMCPKCDEPFVSVAAMHQHRTQRQIPARLTFPGCLKVPAYHMYRCLYCWKSFHGLEKLMVHRELHKDGELFNCEDCHFVGSREDVAIHALNRRHMRIRLPTALVSASAYRNPNSGPD
ncbi:hypothetical protein NliqN6_3993 [Naganishia liquefaciens]|uniref:C2H2-type domain-containing protein n=1 Tax=Naganishia liquefaciens TaxID=104408 RepID=A0A8H3TV98_9TREE|nr:hypothetical protein NliqN6_3993 [Naganishia liquefaciens]